MKEDVISPDPQTKLNHGTRLPCLTLPAFPSPAHTVLAPSSPYSSAFPRSFPLLSLLSSSTLCHDFRLLQLLTSSTLCRGDFRFDFRLLSLLASSTLCQVAFFSFRKLGLFSAPPCLLPSRGHQILFEGDTS